MPKPFFRPFACLLLPLLGGCGFFGASSPTQAPNAPPVRAAAPQRVNPPARTTAVAIARPDLLSAVELASTVTPITTPLTIPAGRSEWVSFVVKVHAPPAGRPATLRLGAFVANRQILRGRAARVYQVLPMPLDVNRAAYVRQTGQAVSAESLPRALLPVITTDGVIDLTKLRDPSRPAEAARNAADQDVLLWVDLRVGIDAAPGHYDMSLTYAIAPAADEPVQTQATLSVGFDVADFVLPDDRHLTMVADLPWERLRRLWPEEFESARPQLLSRTDPNTKAAVAKLDQLMTLAQENRVQVHIPRLQPVVKWRPGPLAIVDWKDYDDLVGPWLSGEQFPDKVPLGFWALPRIDFLSNLAPAAQAQYYVNAASHFDQRDWLRLSPVILAKDSPGRANPTERLILSAEASRVLQAHQRVRVMLPLEPAEVQLANANNPNMIAPGDTERLNCVAPGLISDSTLRLWPGDLKKPQNWLRTDLAGLIPYTGAGGDESDVRVWAWVAFLRHANVIQWNACLPAESLPDKPADPGELVWFYPGRWFGVSGPVQTVQLKWLRRAQQDFEYLRLAEQRGSLLDVLPMARVLTKPVEIQPGQSPEAVYGLLLGTADPNAWATVKPLLVKMLEARGPGVAPDQNRLNALDSEELHWISPLEKPVILPRVADWTVGAPPPGEAGPWVNLRLGFDLYNASDTTPVQNELKYDRPADGWRIDPAPMVIPKLSMFQVVRQNLPARVDPARVNNARHVPVRIEYKSGQTAQTTPLDLVAPVARSVRRTAAGPIINGSLDDWTGDDALQIGPLVKMMSRPAVQQHQFQYASTASDVYSSWGDDDFYLAFRVEGLARIGPVHASRNFIDYQNGRAWGEDVCQSIFQAVYDDGTTGPLVHVAVKPGGNVWVEAQDRPGQPWQQLQVGVRYAATTAEGVWRGEMAVPWAALVNPDKANELAAQGRPNLPTILKFNFIQHKHATGESASWAGPLDSGRDDNFSGVLVLKEPS